MLHSTTLHSDDTEFHTGPHHCQSVLSYNWSSYSEISCLICSCQNSTGKCHSVQASARTQNHKGKLEQHISSVCMEDIWGHFHWKPGHPAPWRASEASSHLREVHLPLPSQQRISLATPVLQRSQIQDHYRKEGRTAILQPFMTILLVWAAFHTPLLLHSDSAHTLYPL